MYDIRDSKWHFSDEEDIGLRIQSVPLLLRALSLFLPTQGNVESRLYKISDTTQ